MAEEQVDVVLVTDGGTDAEPREEEYSTGGPAGPTHSPQLVVQPSGAPLANGLRLAASLAGWTDWRTGVPAGQSAAKAIAQKADARSILVRNSRIMTSPGQMSSPAIACMCVHSGPCRFTLRSRSDSHRCLTT